MNFAPCTLKPTGRELVKIQRSILPCFANTSMRRGSKRFWLIKPFVTSNSKVRSCATFAFSIKPASVSNFTAIFCAKAESSPKGRNSNTVLSASSPSEEKNCFTLSKTSRLCPEINETPSLSVKFTRISTRSPGAKTKDLTVFPCGKNPKSCAINVISCSLSKRKL